jgi:hypothetical protein
MPGLDPGIHEMVPQESYFDLNALQALVDCRVIGERSAAVLRTAVPGNDSLRESSAL